MNALENKKASFIYPLIILAAAFLFILPMIISGPPSGVDLLQHFQFAASVEHSILAGDFFPNWAGQENNGYGGVGLRFYPPLAYYVLALFKISVGDWHLASFLGYFFWSALSGFGIYLWSREWFSEKASAAAAVLYIFAPYHTLQLYSAFIYADFAASAILPFCLLFVTKICRRGSAVDILGLALSLSALILTHLPSTVIGCAAIGFYSLLCLDFKLFSKQSGKLLLGAVLAFVAGSFQWVKVLTEMSWLTHSAEKFSQAGFYDYRQNFILSFPYLSGGIDSDSRGLWFVDLSLLVTLICIVPLAAVFFAKADSLLRKKLFKVLMLSVFAIFMASILSRPIWEHVSILQKIQFPWRWFSIISMSLMIFAAAGFEDYLKLLKNTKLRPYFLLITGGLFIFITFSYAQIMRQSPFSTPAEFAELSKTFASAPNCDCWLPVWGNLETQEVKEKIIAENRTINILEWQDKEIVFQTEAGAETQARLALYYYPHWQATVNGAPLAVSPGADGALNVTLPPDSSTIKVSFVEPPVVKIAAVITLSMLFFLISGVIYLSASNAVKKEIIS